MFYEKSTCVVKSTPVYNLLSVLIAIK